MSAASVILAAGLNVLNTAADRSVEYRATSAAAWVAVTGATAAVTGSEPSYDETGHLDQIIRSGVVRVPIGGTTLENGGQVRLDADDAQIYAIRGKSFGVAVNSYNISAADPIRLGSDRGRSRT